MVNDGLSNIPFYEKMTEICKLTAEVFYENMNKERKLQEEKAEQELESATNVMKDELMYV